MIDLNIILKILFTEIYHSSLRKKGHDFLVKKLQSNWHVDLLKNYFTHTQYNLQCDLDLSAHNLNTIDMFFVDKSGYLAAEDLRVG